jgi:hypothetical protein
MEDLWEEIEKKFIYGHLEIMEKIIEGWGITDQEVLSRISRKRISGDTDPFKEDWIFDNEIIMKIHSEMTDNTLRVVIRYKPSIKVEKV